VLTAELHIMIKSIERVTGEQISFSWLAGLHVVELTAR